MTTTVYTAVCDCDISVCVFVQITPYVPEEVGMCSVPRHFRIGLAPKTGIPHPPPPPSCKLYVVAYEADGDDTRRFPWE